MTATVEELRTAYERRAERVAGGHRRWTGTADPTPLLWVRKERFTVARAAFRLTVGREPVGNVKADCGMPHCVEGEHLTDRLMREHMRAEERAARRSKGAR